MQIVKITQAAIFTEAVTCAMINELAVMVGMTEAQIAAAAKQDLKGGSKTVNKLSCAKLRTIVGKKLHDSVDFGDAFANGGLEVEFACLPDLEPEVDISKAGANKSTAAGNRSRAAGKFAGAYHINAKGKATLAAVQSNDPGRWEIVQHILACSTVESFLKASPAKAVKKVGSLTTASTEFNYAVRSGWVVPGVAA